MKEEFLLWTSSTTCKEYDSFEAAQMAANKRKKGCIEVLKIVGSGLIVDRYDVWSYASGFITDPRK